MHYKQIVLALILLFVVQIVFAGNDALQLTFNTSKTVVMPGDSFYLILNFYNLRISDSNLQTSSLLSSSSTEDAKIHDLTYNPVFPAGLFSNFETNSVGDLGPSVRTTSVLLISVDSSLSEGYYPIRIETSYKNYELQSVNTNYEFLLRVDKPKTLVTLKNVLATSLTPGEAANLSLVFSSDRHVDNLQINLNPSNGLAFDNDNSIKNIDELTPESDKSVNYSLFVTKYSQLGEVQLPISITYVYDGVEYVRNLFTNLDIKGAAKISLTGVETIPVNIKDGIDFDLRLEFENYGTSDAENVSIILNSSFQGINKIFSRSIKASNTGDVIFKLRPNWNSGLNKVKAEILYTDDLGFHSTVEEFNILVLGNSILDYKWFFLILIIFLFAVVLGIYKRKKLIEWFR